MIAFGWLLLGLILLVGGAELIVRGDSRVAGYLGIRPIVIGLALMLVGGIAIVVLGSDWLVMGAVDLARMLDVSEAFIGLTILAIGTSSPEFVTTIVGTLKGDRDVAIGNLLGSSIYNILAILGITCLVPAAGIRWEPI